MEITTLPRKFKITIGNKEKVLEDPDPQFTINEVKEFYTMEYPKLINAEISDQKTEKFPQSFFREIKSVLTLKDIL